MSILGEVKSQKSKAMQRGLGGFPHERLHQEVKSQKSKVKSQKSKAIHLDD